MEALRLLLHPTLFQIFFKGKYRKGRFWVVGISVDWPVTENNPFEVDLLYKSFFYFVVVLVEQKKLQSKLLSNIFLRNSQHVLGTQCTYWAHHVPSLQIHTGIDILKNVQKKNSKQDNYCTNWSKKLFAYCETWRKSTLLWNFVFSAGENWNSIWQNIICLWQLFKTNLILVGWGKNYIQTTKTTHSKLYWSLCRVLAMPSACHCHWDTYHKNSTLIG